MKLLLSLAPLCLAACAGSGHNSVSFASPASTTDRAA